MICCVLISIRTIRFLTIEEEKDRREGKDHPAVWGKELIILLQDDLKKRINSFYSSYRPGAIHPILQISLVQNN